MGENRYKSRGRPRPRKGIPLQPWICKNAEDFRTLAAGRGRFV
jgi:hypothetical protein